MPDKLLIKNRKLVVRNRKLLTTKDGAECCCGGGNSSELCCPDGASTWALGSVPGAGARLTGRLIYKAKSVDGGGFLNYDTEGVIDIDEPIDSSGACAGLWGDAEIQTGTRLKFFLNIGIGINPFSGGSPLPYECGTFPRAVCVGTRGDLPCSPGMSVFLRLDGGNTPNLIEWNKSINPTVCNGGGGILTLPVNISSGSITTPAPTRSNGNTDTAWTMSAFAHGSVPFTPEREDVEITLEFDVTELVDCNPGGESTPGQLLDPRCTRCNAPVMPGASTCAACGFRLGACLGCGP